MKIENLLLPAFAAIVLACSGTSTEVEQAAPSVPESNLKNEWVSLFNGEDFTGWQKYGGDPVGAAWKIDGQGGFYLDATETKDGKIVDGGDIVTSENYDNYELELEWKISDCGNSGIIYNVVESDKYPYPWLTGPEMQILDNSCHPDAKIYMHRAGDLYDMVAGDSMAVKPAGEWNLIKLVVTNGKVEHWMNGKQVVSYTNTGDEWSEMIANSKFKEFPDFGKATSGKISLQDHDNEVHFRNVRIRNL